MKKHTNGSRRSDKCENSEGQFPIEIEFAFRVVSGKWKTLILWQLWRKKRRFGELKRLIPGITQHMLTTTLRELEKDGLLLREAFPEIPPRVEYSLSERGKDLGAVFKALKNWGQKHSRT